MSRVDNNDKVKTINPLLLLVIIDTANIITKQPLSEEELHLFSLDKYIATK